MDGDTRLLSYDELAAALGIDRESARKRATRAKWRKVAANDGTVRVHVPAELLPPDLPPPGVPIERMVSTAAYFDRAKCDAFLQAHEDFVRQVAGLRELSAGLAAQVDAQISNDVLSARLAQAEAARDRALAEMAVIDAGRAEMTRELEESRAELERLRGRGRVWRVFYSFCAKPLVVFGASGSGKTRLALLRAGEDPAETSPTPARTPETTPH